MSALEGPPNSIGIRLIDMPSNRTADPRAQVYIVDHMAPGAVIKRRILVTNNSPIPIHIDMFPGAASIDDDAFDAKPGRATNDLTTWISLDKNALDLAAGHSTEVLTTIAVAATASKGERYGVVWAQTSAPSNTPDNVMLVSRVGIRIYLDVGPGGEQPSSFDIGDLTPARTDDGQPEVLATVHNTGGRALDMAGELSLSDGPGGLGAGPFPATVGTTLLPGHTGRVKTLLDKRLPNGPWKVRLTLRSGSVERTVTATVSFPAAGMMGIPSVPSTWIQEHLLLVACLAVALGAVAVLAVRRRLRRRGGAAGPPP